MLRWEALSMRAATACRVMLESFISTQKLSVQKMLARKFARFMSYKRDFLELLMSTLQSLVREQLQIESITGAVGGDEVLVPLRCAVILNPQGQGLGIRTRIRRRGHGRAAADQVHHRRVGRQRGAHAAAVRRMVRDRDRERV